MPSNKPVLIVATSGRAIAKSARLAGFQPYVLDNYADQDTREISPGVKKIPGMDNRISGMEILSILDDYSDMEFAGVIIGSGFEDKLEIYYQLDERFDLLGNSPETVKKIKDPWLFFPVLKKLGISYPPLSKTVPGDKGTWLAKKTGGCGGGHIKSAIPGYPDNYYYQKYLIGRTLSAVFLAYQDRANLIGISEIWCRNADNMDFIYTGAVTLDLIDSPVTNRIDQIINLISTEYELKGLCGVDCILDDSGQIHVLEVNPRPTASFELFELDTSLIGLHINACTGILEKFVSNRPRSVRAHKIIYADNNLIVPEYFWPDWAIDRPVTGSLIKKGEPVCSIVAGHDIHQNCMMLLQLREKQISRDLGVNAIAA